MKGKEELIVICAKVVGEGERGDESAERSSVHDEGQMSYREQSLGEHRRRSYKRKTDYFHI